MTTVVHITGTSSGLGKALAEVLLRDENTRVIGYSRRAANIDSDRYTHLKADLSEYGSWKQLSCSGDADREILINNAGWIGPVYPVGEMPEGEASRLISVNTSSVLEWTNAFVRNSTAPDKVVITISSGASENAIASWSAYCASKSAIDMATRVWAKDRPDIHFLAIAPGVVDTDMQSDIRECDFPDHKRFMDLHENGDLSDPFLIAEKISRFVSWPASAPSNVFSVRDL